MDLSAFADVDGKPEMDALALVGGRLYAVLARVQGKAAPVDAPFLVAIDPSTRLVEKVLELPCCNPSGELRPGSRADELWVSCLGGPLSRPMSRASGLVRVDLATRTATRILEGESLAGFVTAFAILADDSGVAIVGAWAEGNATSVVAFDPRGKGTLGKIWASRSTYAFWDLEAVGTTVLVADRDEEAPGILVFGAGGVGLGKVRTRLLPADVLPVRSL
ncbi:MAG: hypothetical protein IPJ34_25535 [Myxococcales bacterium]|nr:hypothetical protein [Myxococcales bacterium]